ncbi:hypothetical protein ABMA58_01125, partial [Oceanospirillum sp. HFRX-1_2]
AFGLFSFIAEKILHLYDSCMTPDRRSKGIEKRADSAPALSSALFQHVALNILVHVYPARII